jgi:hypothetical protein
MKFMSFRNIDDIYSHDPHIEAILGQQRSENTIPIGI